MKFGTKTIHAGIEPDKATGSIMTPIYQTSTYVQKAPGEHSGYEYSRSENPTRTVLENNIAALENGSYGLCFSSGMAAIDAIVKLFKPGDEIIATNDLYGGTYRMFKQVFEPFGIKFHFISMEDIHNIEQYINANTRLLWIETPTNPLNRIIDIAGAVNIARRNKLLTAVDNTFATPYLQLPLDLGVDIVMHSVTKYLGGHSDVVMGALVTNSSDLHEGLQFVQKSCGAIPGPQDCFLVLRGIKTLHLRMQQHCNNGRKVAHFLKEHPLVQEVHWPGFEDFPNYDVAARQMHDFGGMVSFTLKGDQMEDAMRFLQRVNVFSLAESLGGVESLCGHPASMTHASIPKEEREKAGLKDSLIRLSVGIEDPEDLIEDLEAAIGE